MRDLTTGSVLRHLLVLATPIASSIVATSLFLIVDIYFVAQLGEAALAGVSATANATFLVTALGNVLTVGASVAISHAAGRKDRREVNAMFNQVLRLSLCLAGLLLVSLFLFAHVYVDVVVSGSAAARHAALSYLLWLAPGLALQVLLAGFRAGLRGTGTFVPSTVSQISSIALNIVLAPVLVLGWGTGHVFGAAGAGLATSIAMAFAIAVLLFYFLRSNSYLHIDFDSWRIRWRSWREILVVGLPAGGESLLLFAYVSLIYWLIRDFGDVAQAGFGVGSRVMQALSMPAMALAYAVAPIAGQSIGAGNMARVRRTCVVALTLVTCVMITLSAVCHGFTEPLIKLFTADAAVVANGAGYLSIALWGFVLQGAISVCTSVLQSFRQTRLVLAAAALRALAFAAIGVLISAGLFDDIHTIWWASIGALLLQATFALWCTRAQLQSTLTPRVTADDLSAASRGA